MEPLLIPLSLLAGTLLTVQAGANAQLAKAVASPFAATTIQIFIAGLLLLVIALFTGTVTAFGRLPAAPWLLRADLGAAFPVGAFSFTGIAIIKFF